jgi:hypothetical protein
MKKLLLTWFAVVVVLFSLPAVASGQSVVIMPDSVSNALVAFSPQTGALITSNMFSLAGGTPNNAIQVGNEIWVSEQIGNRVSRWSFTGTYLGEIGGAAGGLSNIRGMALVGDTLYITNAGTTNGAPGPAVVMYSVSGGAIIGNFSTVGLAPSPYDILPYQGGLLVSSSQANDDIHRFTLTGMSLGTFHNSTSLNFVQQMAYASNGQILAAGFSLPTVVAWLDPTTGAIVDSFNGGAARGVFQLGNGNVLYTNSSGTFVFDVTTRTSTQVYAGAGRYLEHANIPEPSSIALAAAGTLLLAAAHRLRRRAR